MEGLCGAQGRGGSAYDAQRVAEVGGDGGVTQCIGWQMQAVAKAGGSGGVMRCVG